MALYPAVNDTEAQLYFKIAQNFYEIALNSGVTGLTPPVYTDYIFNQASKTCYYTASID